MPNPLAVDNPVSIVLAPIVWSVYFVVVYVFNALACARGFVTATVWGLPLVPSAIMLATLVTLELLGGLAWLAWRRFVPVRDAAHLVHERGIEESIPARRRFMAYCALLLCGLSAIATIMVGMPALWVPPCG